MRLARLLLIGCASAALSAGSIAPATASSHVASGKAPKCTSGEANVKASKFNTTPKGPGPWHVPLDRCNTEGAGATATPYVNCAYWAAEKRPDIWVNAVLKYGYSASRPGAWRIKVDARKAGYPIDHHPKAGDVAAWGRNAPMGAANGGIFTASPGGHVAYVEKVRSRSTIVVSTMGFPDKKGHYTGGFTTTLTYDKKHTFFIHHS